MWIPEGTTSTTHMLGIPGDTTKEDNEILYVDGFSVHPTDVAWGVGLTRIIIAGNDTSANAQITADKKKEPFPVRNLRVDTSIHGQVTIIWRKGKVGGGDTPRCRRAKPQPFYCRLDNLTARTMIADD